MNNKELRTSSHAWKNMPISANNLISWHRRIINTSAHTIRRAYWFTIAAKIHKITEINYYTERLYRRGRFHRREIGEVPSRIKKGINENRWNVGAFEVLRMRASVSMVAIEKPPSGNRRILLLEFNARILCGNPVEKASIESVQPRSL